MKRVLVIEDDRATREQLVKLLRFENFEVSEAPDGAAGIEVARRVRPDAIICDIMMPGQDGFEVLEQLRANPQTAATPFIFLTAKADLRDVRHGMRNGADDYVTKPFEVSELLASLRVRLQRQELHEDEKRRVSEEAGLAAAAVLPRELLAPLDHIETVTELLALNDAHGLNVSAMCESVRREAAKVRRALQRLSLYSRLPALYADRFASRAEFEPAPAGPVVEKTALQVAGEYGRSGDLHFINDTAAVPLSPEHLAIIAQELVSNACKFSAPGSRIEVAVKGEAQFSAIRVSDSGPGLSSERIQEIAAFRQFHNGGNRPSGLGLGLALVQGLVRLYGGELHFEPGEGGGLCASLLLPAEGNG
jgi:two-component system, sensor histidine kinase and response regulator